MKQVALFILLILSTTCITAQTIELANSGLLINSIRIKEGHPVGSLKKILGEPSRITHKFNTIWTYDSLGISVYVDSENTIKAIELSYKNEELPFSPKMNFSGRFSINNYGVNGNTAPSDFGSLKGVIVKKDPLRISLISRSDIEVFPVYMSNYSKLDAISISFK